jgi:hypothetical protein
MSPAPPTNGRAICSWSPRSRQRPRGILAWLVRGGLEWQRGGLQTPPACDWRAIAYRTGESIEPFLTAACIVVEDQAAEGGALFAAYQNWCKANTIRHKNQNWFGKQLQQRFEKGRLPGVGRTVYYGVRLETTEFEPPAVDNPSHISTTLHTLEYPSAMPNVEEGDRRFTRFCEGLVSISKSSEENSPRERKDSESPSHPSHPSQSEVRVLPQMPSLPAYAMWHGPHADEPVTVVADLGLGTDGRRYVAIDGSQTDIPADEVEFFDEAVRAAA